ncbi:DEAD/DEAH box helicase [Enterobacter cloacae]
MNTIEFSSADVKHAFGQKTIEKAQPYIGTFTTLVTDRRLISGEVKGSAKQAYRVLLHISRIPRGISLAGECSCPVRWQCKHAAALALTHLKREEEMATGGINYQLLEWAKRFQQQRKAAKKSKAPSHTLIFALDTNTESAETEVNLIKAQLDKNGKLLKFENYWSNLKAAVARQPTFVTDDDLLTLQMLLAANENDNLSSFVLQGKSGAMILERILASGRCMLMSASKSLSVKDAFWLRLGALRPAEASWVTLPDNLLKTTLKTEPSCSSIILLDPPHYLDSQTGEVGPTDVDLTYSQLRDFLSIPVIRQEEAGLVANVLAECASELPSPPELKKKAMRKVATDPVPCLRLSSQCFDYYDYRTHSIQQEFASFAILWFDYQGIAVEPDSADNVFITSEGEMVEVERAVSQEKNALLQMKKAGVRKARTDDFSSTQRKSLPAQCYTIKESGSMQQWLAFIRETVPALREQGWKIDIDPDFAFNITEIEQIDGTATQGEDGWFDIEMGVMINEQVVSLVPLLSDLFIRDRRWLQGNISIIPDEEQVLLYTERGEKAMINAKRLKVLVGNLFDLIGPRNSNLLRLSKWDAGRLVSLEDTGRWQFNGQSPILTLAQRLRAEGGLNSVTPPTGLHASLRGYQLQGLSWMQFLRKHDLSGVLADEMGLGKTIQTLAHILLEKEAGRLDKPALIVMPTTLVSNWQHEAKRFTPALKVLALNGPQRTESFAKLSEFDVILSTYALLWRDEETLISMDYHLLILDEAQYVKNSRTQAAQVIRRITARHRLCLTGTPLENHLGELWSQFDFLLPGFLGSQKEFNRLWRSPIEKDGHLQKKALLARRIRPFILRRSKKDVAKELPPKNVIERSVELEGTQRDLYESVRAAMQKKVRHAIAEKGLARSHIVVLDALLKLRQVCCDPRLVKLPAAVKVKESAKLDMLREMVTELIAEGRRILLFSQFTGMLALIAEAMDSLKIPYVMLTGETQDRQTPVARFQNKDVPLFLISLKAGGVGLNLTAADTVIHYDPWWNPATENQATDRAHRIGQDKTVFVYKLVVAGSIEQKIVALQEKKASLANSILSEDSAFASKFSEEEINSLFERIE